MMNERSDKELAIQLVCKYLEANPAAQNPTSGTGINVIPFKAVLKMLEAAHDTVKNLD